MESTFKKKQSFRDISPREYMYFPKGTLEMGKPGQISKLELKHISISMIVMIISFTFALSQNSLVWSLINGGISYDRIFQGFLFSLLGIFSAFFFHELSHKLMAQYYGLWSEFRMYPKALMISLVLSITTGFAFAAPGAVMFRGEPRVFEEGKIAMAGPLANIFLAGVFLPVFLFTFFQELGLIAKGLGFICLINTIFALFNVLPFGPLDGVNIVKWSKFVWISLIIISSCLFLILLQFIPQIIGN